MSRSPGSGKDALAPITQAILNRVLSQSVGSYQRLLGILGDQARGRHLLLYMHDRDASRVLSRARYDGAVLDPPGDYLMVTDANVGATKGDYYLKRSIHLQAEIPDKGTQRHRVTLQYAMPPVADAIDAALNPSDGGSYHDYVRVFLPENAEVANARFALDDQPTADKLDLVSFAHGHEVVGAYLRVPRGHRFELTIDYFVPSSGSRSYQLYVQKQAGTPGTPVQLEVSYPGGRLVSRKPLTSDYQAVATW